MAVSVVETVDITTYTNAGLTWRGTLTTTPAAGDALIVMAEGANALPISKIVGCGATWALAFQRAKTGSGGGVAQAVWVGASPTTSGTVEITLSSFADSVYRVFLIRGLDSPTVTAAANAETQDGPVQSAGAGQIVLGMAGRANTTVTVDGTAPAAGWVAQSTITSRNILFADSTYRIPATTADHSVTASAPSAVGIMQAVIGGAGPSHDSALATGARVGLTFAVESIVPVVPTGLAAGARVGLTFAASTVAPTTLGAGATVDLTFMTESAAYPETTLATGARVGFTFNAHTAAATSLMTGAVVGLTFTAAGGTEPDWPDTVTLTEVTAGLELVEITQPLTLEDA